MTRPLWSARVHSNPAWRRVRAIGTPMATPTTHRQTYLYLTPVETLPQRPRTTHCKGRSSSRNITLMSKRDCRVQIPLNSNPCCSYCTVSCSHRHGDCTRSHTDYRIQGNISLVILPRCLPDGNDSTSGDTVSEYFLESIRRTVE